jgi:hypothetical protein
MPYDSLLQINKAIQKYPENLEIRLLWIDTLIRMQKENKVKEYLRTSPRFQDALISLHLHIAHIDLIIGIISSVLQVKRLEIWGLFLGVKNLHNC